MLFHILVAGGEPYLCLFHTFGKVVPHSWHNRSHYLGTTVSKAWHNFATAMAQLCQRRGTIISKACHRQNDYWKEESTKEK